MLNIIRRIVLPDLFLLRLQVCDEHVNEEVLLVNRRRQYRNIHCVYNVLGGRSGRSVGKTHRFEYVSVPGFGEEGSQRYRYIQCRVELMNSWAFSLEQVKS